MRRAAAAFLFVLATVACGSTSSRATHQVGDVTLTVTGGFTGWNRQLVVDSSGTARLFVTSGPRPGQGSRPVSAATLARLRSLVGDPAFARLDSEYPAPIGSADIQTYAVTADVDGQLLGSTTYNGATAPQVLRDVIGVMVGILGSFTGTAATCRTGYSASSPAIHLALADDESVRNAPLCAAIWIVLLSPGDGFQWQFVQSSDPSVLEVVPLPLPRPPGGDTEAVYLAKQVGTARLSSGALDLACPAGGYCRMEPAWNVTITVG